MNIRQSFPLSHFKFCKIRKGTKKPYELDWVNKPYSWEQIQEHIQLETNYGVICGYEGLVVIDADTPELLEATRDTLPKTYTVHTGSGGMHFYYYCPEVQKKIVLQNDMIDEKTGKGKHFGEVQSYGAQVVGANSIHPNGQKYTALNNLEIVEISYEELMNLIKPFMKEVVREDDRILKELGEKWNEQKKDFGDGDINSISITSVISTAGFKRAHNGEFYGSNPWHGSDTGMNFWVNTSKNVARCFRCLQGINVAQAIGLNEGIIHNCGDKLDRDSFIKVLRVAQEKYGLKKPEKSVELKVITEKEDIKSAYLDLTHDKKWSDASELLVKYLRETNHFFTTRNDSKTEMWIYRDGIYVPQGKSCVKEMVREVLGKHFSQFIYNLVLNKLEADTYIDQDEFFNHNYLEEIPVLNGVLDLKTRVLSPFTPDKVFFNKIRAEYNPFAKCVQIDKFLMEVLTDSEDKKVFYEIGGFCLWKEYTFEKAFMFVGNGRNGKDKSLELVKRLLGMENCCSVPLASIVPDSFIISSFHNKMANLAGEISNQDLKDASAFKGLTGRSLQSAPRKFLSPITFVNHAKFIFACNELPMVYDNSRGFWDRWVVLEYPFTFVTKEELANAIEKKGLKLRDESIIDKITTPEEMSGLLNMFLDGLDRLNKVRKFSSTKGSEEVKLMWIRKSNSVMAFAMAHVEEDGESFILKRMFRKKYSDYCKHHKVIPRSDKVIMRTLEDLFGASDSRRLVMDRYEQIWEGIKFK